MGQVGQKSVVKELITIEFEELLELVDKINQKCVNSSGESAEATYLHFYVKNATNDIFWKAVVRICCVSKSRSDPGLSVPTPGRTFSLRQFLRLYHAIEPLLDTAGDHNLNQMFNDNDVMTMSIFQDSCTTEGECVICLEREPDTILPCAHAYCSKCLDDCRRHNQKCPLCRVGSTYEEDEWVVPKVPDASKINAYVSELSKPE